jgi:hypothetical protein
LPDSWLKNLKTTAQILMFDMSPAGNDPVRPDATIGRPAAKQGGSA